MTLSSSRGIALVTVLLVSSLVFTMALGLSLVVSVNQLVVRNHCRVGRAGALRPMPEWISRRTSSADADWNAVLTGLVQASGSDGAPTGPRASPGTHPRPVRPDQPVELRPAAGCSDGDMQGMTADRPWGVNNPRWRLFLYGPLGSLVPLHASAAIYLLVWVGDDGREADGAPESDGGSPAGRRGAACSACTRPPSAAMAGEGAVEARVGASLPPSRSRSTVSSRNSCAILA